MSDYHRFVPPIGKARYFGLTHRQVLESLSRERLERWKARLDSLRSEPFRGVTTDGQVGSELDPRQRQVLLDLTERYLSTLPPGPLRAHISDVGRHFAQTHFCWADGLDEESAFYYRIQSPVVMIEFGHHKGVLFTNETPQRFHVHTIVRTPNGNDYGMDSCDCTTRRRLTTISSRATSILEDVILRIRSSQDQVPELHQ